MQNHEIHTKHSVGCYEWRSQWPCSLITSVSGKGSRQADCRYFDPQADEGSRQTSRNQEAGLFACASTQLRERTTRIGRGLVDDQQTTLLRKFYDDDEVFALPTF